MFHVNDGLSQCISSRYACFRRVDISQSSQNNYCLTQESAYVAQTILIKREQS